MNKTNRDLILAVIVMALIGLLIMQHFLGKTESAPTPTVTQVPAKK